jgi:Mg2+-importing ATPase
MKLEKNYIINIKGVDVMAAPASKGMFTEEYWSEEAAELLLQADSARDGLASSEAAARLSQSGPNVLKLRRGVSALRSFFSQFTSPLVLILIFAAAVSVIAGELADALIVIAIVFASAVLSFIQEYSASNAVEKLRAQVTIKATVMRDGKPQTISAEEIVPGDIVLLSAGSLIPADSIVLEANDFFVNQAVLTGETFPVEKKPGPVEAGAGLAERINSVFMGTSVRSGTARTLAVRTGTSTEFGQIADRLTVKPLETEFESGIRRFGYLLTRIIAILVIAVLFINILLDKPAIDSLLFAIALAVGIAPELLPAIINVNLSKGAQKMAKSGVIVRQLSAIENLGSMDILCTDKTGTITEGVVRLDGAFDLNGSQSDKVMLWAYLNAAFQTGISNPLDEAILAQPHPDTAGMDKLEEIPYDFVRKRLSVVVDTDPGTEIKPLLITKGALDNVVSICSYVMADGTAAPIDEAHRTSIGTKYAEWSSKGFRVLGIAVRDVPRQAKYTVSEDEREMTFAGFLLFFDPPKTDVKETLAELSGSGVEVKIITGDNRLVARHVAESIGLDADSILPASRLKEMSDEALWNAAESTTIFAEVDPNQKERIIMALRKTGHVVGFMGDGINDAPALHAADVGISVEKAVDVAKEAADFVLLRHDLDILLSGIREGRRTFANTLKYIFTTTSANFGNMLSMAGASLFLPFLPLLAKQILLNNFLSDIPAIGMPGDNVDEDMVSRPHRWNIHMIRNFMVIFGLVSSVFDYATFGLLILVAHASEQQFQTGWFIESLLTELVIALVVRTRKVFYKSRPGRLLWVLTLSVGLLTILAPYLPFSRFLGFTPLPLWLMGALIGLTLLYVAAVEVVKKHFFSRFNW